MFSLIITIISIALVAALALATLFYGGQALNKGGEQAQATKLLNQSQQILGASDLFKADHGRWPYDLPELVNTGYLRTIPVSQLEGGALRNANAAEEILGQWKTPLPGRPVYVTEDVSAGVCSKVNLMTMKVDAVYAGLVPEVNSQCFAGGGKYKAVASREWPAIPEAFPQASVASGMPAPADAGWVVVEGRELSPAGAGGTGEGGGQTAAPALSVSALQHDFGARPLGTANPLQVTVRNTGTAAMAFNSTPAVSGDPAFALTSTNCGPSLGAGGQCTVELSFTPGALAQAAGSLAIATNATASPTVVQLTGSGLGAVTTLSSHSLAFGAQNVGGSSSLRLTVGNEGNVAFDFTQAPAVSGNAAFSLVSTTCGAVLDAGTQCTVTVSFNPTSVSAVGGSLVFGAGGAPYEVSLSGSGLAAALRFEDGLGNELASLDFPATPVGTNSSARTVTLRNSGDADLIFTGSLGAPAPFSVQATTCTDATLAPNSTCSVSVVFSPPTQATYSGTQYVLSSSTNALVPQSLLLTGTGSAVGVSAVAAGYAHTLVLRQDGTLWSSGMGYWGALGDGTNVDRNTFSQVLTGVSSIAAGRVTSFAIKQDGTLWASGRNTEGQLGDGTTVNVTRFKQVLADVSAVAGGYQHTLVLKKNGSAWASGENGNGQLGNGVTTDRTTFAQVKTSVADIAAGELHSVFLLDGGAVNICGARNHGQRGDGISSTGTTSCSAPLSGVSKVFAAINTTFALKADGTLWASGENTGGQLGIGSLTSTGAFTQALTGVTKVAPSGSHTLAIKGDNSLWHTGANNGAAGDGSTARRTSFAPVGSGAADAAAGGAASSFVIKSDGTLWASGDNMYGQLGAGDTAGRTTFTKVLP